MKKILFIGSFVFLATVLVVLSCAKSETPSSPGTTSQKYLYIATGASYAGNTVSVPTPGKIIAKFSLDGKLVYKVRDYNDGSGDYPIGILNYDSKYLLALIENTSGRRIVRVAKDGSGSETNFFINNSSLSAVLRAFTATPDGGVLVSKSSAIEKVNSSRARITLGGNPFISGPAGNCATTTTLVTAMAYGPLNSIFMAHAAAGENQINVISSTGYAAAADCLGYTDAPAATDYPTAMIYHSSGKMLVSYCNDATLTHRIYSYDVTNATINNASKIFDDNSVLQGMTSMVEMPDATILVASTTFGTVERFTYGAGKLIKATSTFLSPSQETASVSGMFIAD